MQSTALAGKSPAAGLNSARAQEVKQVGSGAGRGYPFSYYSEVKKVRGGLFLLESVEFTCLILIPPQNDFNHLKNIRETYVILITNSTFCLVSEKGAKSLCLLNFFNNEERPEDHL